LTSALLTTDDPSFLVALNIALDGCQRVDLAMAFVQPSGVRLIEERLDDLLARGGRLRLFAGANAGPTSSRGLRHFLDLKERHPDQVVLWAMEPGEHGIFHVKAALVHDAQGPVSGFVGSANLTAPGFRHNREWVVQLHAPASTALLLQLQTALDAFEHGALARVMDERWMREFEQREACHPFLALPELLVVESADEPPPAPHSVQREALVALAAARAGGHRAALVVMATGLGKTWLAAFDAVASGARRVLFVAHREEILGQAMRTFRRIMPDASIGFYTGTEKDRDATLVMASVQTLGREQHRRTFDPEAFDYIIVDEFHHAAAPTYRNVIGHFEPRFLLGLTATPMRRDGQELLVLCGDNLAFNCPLWEGIGRELLAPLRYYGVPDDIDYTKIRWNAGRFDMEDLERAAVNDARAERALAAIRQHGGQRVLAFCVSLGHADYMASFFQRSGLRAVAVHSGETSAPRAASLERFQAGELDVLCAVDMFNEGVDVPAIDTVLMLRPTESPVIWLQQLGRGLRRAEGKPHLTVIDFIGNHRMFLDRPAWLLGDQGLEDTWETRVDLIAQVFSELRMELPPDCLVEFEPSLLERFLELLKKGERADLERLIRLEALGEQVEGRVAVGAELTRREIAASFGYPFSDALWNQGFVVCDRDVFLLVTLDKAGMFDVHQYGDKFISASEFQWQSQNRTEQASKHGRIIRDHARLGYVVHLMVRAAKKRGAISLPFVYCGQVDFVKWDGEKPITVTWRLRGRLPEATLRQLQPQG